MYYGSKYSVFGENTSQKGQNAIQDHWAKAHAICHQGQQKYKLNYISYHLQAIAVVQGAIDNSAILEKHLDGRLPLHDETTVVELLCIRNHYSSIFNRLRVISFRISNFSFSHILGPKIPGRISEMGESICTKYRDMIAQSSAQIRFILSF